MEQSETDAKSTIWPHSPEGFEGFYADSWTGAVRVAALLTQDASAAEEIAQDAFLSVLGRWPEVREPAAFLYRCIANAAAMYHRRAGTVRRKLPLLNPPAAASATFEELADVVAALPFRQRAVIVLRYYAGLTEQEIADTLKCRPGTVKSLASRALSTLHKELA